MIHGDTEKMPIGVLLGTEDAIYRILSIDRVAS